MGGNANVEFKVGARYKAEVCGHLVQVCLLVSLKELAM